jgi:DNA-binding SARP family transcriptional activator/TolB-like protein
MCRVISEGAGGEPERYWRVRSALAMFSARGNCMEALTPLSTRNRSLNMLQSKELRLLTLGRLGLLTAGGDADPSLSARRRKLALLAVVATARRPLSRDYLAEMFWGNQPEDRARHSLSSTLSHLRRVLGRDALTLAAAEVELHADDRLTVDAHEFVDAIAAKDDEAAVALYAGPFLDGVRVEGSNSFEDWVTTERTRLEALFAGACERRCHELAKEKRWEECAAVAQRWLDAAPLSGLAALFRLNALRAPGTRESYQQALAEFERLRVRLDRDFGQRPDKSVTELARKLASQVAAVGATEEFAVPESLMSPRRADTVVTAGPDAEQRQPQQNEATPSANEPQPVSPQPVSPQPVSPQPEARRISARFAAMIAAAIVLPLVAAWLVLSNRNDSAGANADVPIAAIIDIGFIGTDSTSGWIADGLPQMLAAKLSRSRDIEIIAPDRITAVRARAELPRGAPIPAERARELAGSVGATWVVTGAVTDVDTLLRLDLTVVDARNGQTIRVLTMEARNVLALAEAAAGRLLDAAGYGGDGPQLADVETPNAEAYEHYVRYLQLRHASYFDALRELDSAIALDSGFVSALRARMEFSRGAEDRATLLRLDSAFQRNAYRSSDWDRLLIAAEDAYLSGDWPRAIASGRALIERFPRDPRAYQWMANTYAVQGRWDDALRASQAQLALDSLSVKVGRGPCSACYAYHSLAMFTMNGLGDYAGGERLLRRLVELQPEVAVGWSLLAQSLSAQGRFGEALVAEQRATRVSDTPQYHHMQMVRHLLMARRYAEADSAIAKLRQDSTARAQQWVRELRGMLAMERGSRAPDGTDVPLQSGDSLQARRLMAAHTHPPFGSQRTSIASPNLSVRPSQEARQFTLQHMQFANAIGFAADTTLLRILADSIEMIGGQSFAGRDRVMHHHVRGIIAMRASDWASAERHFASVTQFTTWGAMRTLLLQARAQIAQGRGRDAIRTLRAAYAVPLEGHVTYVPRSELDDVMAMAFERTGERDSARVYAEYAKRARGSDAGVVKELERSRR